MMECVRYFGIQTGLLYCKEKPTDHFWNISKEMILNLEMTHKAVSLIKKKGRYMRNINTNNTP